MRWALVAGAFLLFGCFRAGSRQMITAEELGLKNLASRNNELVIASESIPVVTETKAAGGRTVIRFLSHGAEIEREEYETGKSELVLLRTTTDGFEPGLPVLRFPLFLGKSWAWKGSIRSGDLLVPAEAEIMPIRESLLFPPADALKISVNLTIRDRDTSRREMAFWFIEGRGLVQRQFGSSVRREKK